jgi:hypothetical protein
MRALLIIWVLFFYGLERNQTASAAVAKDCEVGAEVAVNSEYGLRTAPSATARRVVNKKTSAVIRETWYYTVYGSQSLKVQSCSGDWTEVSDIKDPDEHGWVPTKIIRKIERTADGKRVYVESDFSWDRDTSRFKKAIVTIVNKITRENRNCSKMEEGSLDKDTFTNDNPKDPRFFIACDDSSGDSFNVYFRPSDAGNTLTATPAIEQGAAMNACERAAKARARHPSTVSFSRFVDAAYSAGPDGRATLESTFTAKNSFNLEVKYQIRCLFDGQKMIEATVTEAR